MQEVRSAILKLTVLILGIWLFIPSEIGLGTIILGRFQRTLSNQAIAAGILWLRLLGIVLIASGLVLLIKQLHESESI